MPRLTLPLPACLVSHRPASQTGRRRSLLQHRAAASRRTRQLRLLRLLRQHPQSPSRRLRHQLAKGTCWADRKCPSRLSARRNRSQQRQECNRQPFCAGRHALAPRRRHRRSRSGPGHRPRPRLGRPSLRNSLPRGRRFPHWKGLNRSKRKWRSFSAVARPSRDDRWRDALDHSAIKMDTLGMGQ